MPTNGIAAHSIAVGQPGANRVLSYTQRVMARQDSTQILGLGPLEAKLMQVLWRQGPSLASEVERIVNRRRGEPLAYTTILNVLLNLEKKGLVDHEVEGRAYRFAPKLTEAEFADRRARTRSRELLKFFGDAAVSAFVAEVRSGPELTAQLRKLVEEGDEDERETGS
jgi:predicted transcriptional regulator